MLSALMVIALILIALADMVIIQSVAYCMASGRREASPSAVNDVPVRSICAALWVPTIHFLEIFM